MKLVATSQTIVIILADTCEGLNKMGLTRAEYVRELSRRLTSRLGQPVTQRECEEFLELMAA